MAVKDVYAFRAVFAGRLGVIMAARGLNITQLAEMAGVRRETLSQVLACKIPASERVFIGVCRALEVEPWVFWLRPGDLDRAVEKMLGG